MKAFTLAFTLVTVLLASPVFGQQPTDKPEIPPWDGAIFANGVTRVSTHVDIRWGTLRFPKGSLPVGLRTVLSISPFECTK
jgi:hypothetical protein